LRKGGLLRVFYAKRAPYEISLYKIITLSLYHLVISLSSETFV
jgi:hypothetical protein